VSRVVLASVEGRPASGAARQDRQRDHAKGSPNHPHLNDRAACDWNEVTDQHVGELEHREDAERPQRVLKRCQDNTPGAILQVHASILSSVRSCVCLRTRDQWPFRLDRVPSDPRRSCAATAWCPPVVPSGMSALSESGVGGRAASAGRVQCISCDDAARQPGSAPAVRCTRPPVARGS